MNRTRKLAIIDVELSQPASRCPTEIAGASATQGCLSEVVHLSYGQIYCGGGVALMSGLFVAWTRPHAVPRMIAGWMGMAKGGAE